MIHMYVCTLYMLACILYIYILNNMDIIYNMDILIYIWICPGFDSKGGQLVNLFKFNKNSKEN